MGERLRQCFVECHYGTFLGKPPPYSYPVPTYRNERNMKRKIDARKRSWEEGGKVTLRFPFFLPLMHRELTKSLPLITVRIKRSDSV